MPGAKYKLKSENLSPDTDFKLTGILDENGKVVKLFNYKEKTADTMSYILSGPVVNQISHLQFKTTAESGLVELRDVEIHKAVATKRKEKLLKNIAKYNWTEKYVVEAKASIYVEFC